MLQRTPEHWVPKPFQRPLHALKKRIINPRAETSATFTSHTIQCVHKLSVEENIYLSLVVIIKSMMWEFLEALYLPPGVPYCKSVSTQAVNTTINQHMTAVQGNENQKLLVIIHNINTVGSIYGNRTDSKVLQ